MSTRLKVKVLSVLSVILLFEVIGLLPKYDGKINPEIQLYVTAVENLSKGNLVPIAGMDFGYTKKVTLASCLPVTGEITVNKENWAGLNYQQRITLIAHEIAHCSWGTEHIFDVGIDACYTSFMSPNDTGKKCTAKLFNKYVKEMQEMECQ